jgi:hypothetical protein
MGIDGMRDKATDALSSEQGEKASDSALQKGADAASSASGGSHDEQIDKAQSAADERLGEH